MRIFCTACGAHVFLASLVKERIHQRGERVEGELWMNGWMSVCIPFTGG